MPVRDHAKIVTEAVLQLLQTVPSEHRREHLEQLLRDEFSDERRQAISDWNADNA